MRSFVILFLACFFFTVSHAQQINGDVTDLADSKPLADVTVLNIHTDGGGTTDISGRFSVAASGGQLLEFRKLGYKTLRIRLPQGMLPPYFKVIMQKGPVELPEFMLKNKGRNYAKDSAAYHELYKTALEFPELSGMGVIAHPFSALSKRNRQIWAFQKEYNWFEQEKYIDYTFNGKLVTDLTGLTGDSLQLYLRAYRPAYEQLRGMNEYAFFSYIKETVNLLRTGRRYRPSIRRLPN